MSLSRCLLIALGTGWVAVSAALTTGPAAPLAGAPAPAARSWILVDFGSGQTLAEGTADQRIEPASLTK